MYHRTRKGTTVWHAGAVHEDIGKKPRCSLSECQKDNASNGKMHRKGVLPIDYDGHLNKNRPNHVKIYKRGESQSDSRTSNSVVNFRGSLSRLTMYMTAKTANIAALHPSNGKYP